jgi:hypothetical protein
MGNLKRKKGRPPGQIDANAKPAPPPPQNIQILIIEQFSAGLSVEALSGLHKLRISQVESTIREYCRGTDK